VRRRGAAKQDARSCEKPALKAARHTQRDECEVILKGVAMGSADALCAENRKKIEKKRPKRVKRS
jgi:hypothetical protein